MLNQPIMAGSGPIHHVLGMTHEYRLLPGTGVGLVVDVTVPSGCGAPTHSHDTDEELFYVVSGELTVVLDGAVHLLGPGDSCFAPQGREHSFANHSDTETRFLAIVTPGADAYAFFKAVHVSALEAAPTPEAVVKLASANGMVFA